MIKALELRIGNIIEGTFGVRTIKEISENEVAFEGIPHKLHIDQCQPIPLTPEILEKAGFAEENKYLYKRKYFVIIDWSEDGFLLKEFTLKENLRQKEFKYLHQLQNLYFALTGEELEINI